MADQVSVGKTKMLPKYGPGRAGFAVKKQDSRLWIDIDGTPRPINTDNVLTKTTTASLTAKESGSTVLFDSTTAFTITLPAAAVGLSYNFIVKTPASATGHVIAVTGSTTRLKSKVSPTGAAIADANGKGVLNTQATSVAGDGMQVWSDGTNWFGRPTGTWTVQP